jgi:hypothetical protein
MRTCASVRLAVTTPMVSLVVMSEMVPRCLGRAYQLILHANGTAMQNGLRPDLRIQ